MDNKKIARILRETAELLQIDGAIIGRYRSYEKAAELIEGLPQPVTQLVETPEKLLELPGIGQGMVEHLTEIVKTGDYSLRKKLLKKYPETILEVLSLQSLGPKKAALLWKHFKAGSVEEVGKLAKEGKLRELAGFGEKSEQNILRAVEWANRNGLRTFGCTGYNGGQLRQMAQQCFHVSLDDMGIVETVHLTAFHWLVGDLHRRIGWNGTMP